MKEPAGETRVKPDKLNLGERHHVIIQEVHDIAKETGHSMAQVAINWVRQRPDVQIIPIVGARSAVQLQDNLGTLEWELSDAQLQKLDAVSEIELGFPHDFLEGNPYIFGATFKKIDKSR